jgi:hypothetical protein
MSRNTCKNNYNNAYIAQMAFRDVYLTDIKNFAGGIEPPHLAAENELNMKHGPEYL